jgi:hypothetical protein
MVCYASLESVSHRKMHYGVRKKVGSVRGRMPQRRRSAGYSDNWILIPAFIGFIAISIWRLAVVYGHPVFSRETVRHLLPEIAIAFLAGGLMAYFRRRRRKNRGPEG